MTSQSAKTAAFRAMHVKGKPLILYNIWDAGSAKAIAEAGVKAIATSSWAVARSHGLDDGEQLPLELALDNARRIVAAVDLPVTLDLESGYGKGPAQVAETVRQAIGTGICGFNLEDQDITAGGLISVERQAERIRGAHDAVQRSDLGVFINARTDVFLEADAGSHDRRLLGEALARADAYRQAGADGIFVPGLVDAELIREFCAQCALSVNVMMPDTASFSRDVAALGVARVSGGGGPYYAAMQQLKAGARSVVKGRPQPA